MDGEWSMGHVPLSQNAKEGRKHPGDTFLLLISLVSQKFQGMTHKGIPLLGYFQNRKHLLEQQEEGMKRRESENISSFTCLYLQQKKKAQEHNQEKFKSNSQAS